jgi:hypothetical protein
VAAGDNPVTDPDDFQGLADHGAWQTLARAAKKEPRQGRGCNRLSTVEKPSLWRPTWQVSVGRNETGGTLLDV